MLGLDAQFNIISYAVISSKYEKNQNISLSFIPLLEHVLLSIDTDQSVLKGGIMVLSHIFMHAVNDLFKFFAHGAIFGFVNVFVFHFVFSFS